MGFDPQDILNAATGETGDPGKGKKPSSGFDISTIHEAAQVGGSGNAATGGRNLIGGAIDPSTNFNDFRFQPKTNADNYLLRAQDQGFWESLGKTLGNTIANIPLDVVQGVGYLGTLMEMGDDRDYSNTLTKELEKLKNPAGEIYLEHPEKTIDLGDSAWWMNNLGGLAESAASFAVEGAGIAKIFGTLAKTAAWSTRAAKFGAKAAQGLSAATLTYMEGAMSGAQVYETAYNNNYMKMYQQGMDPSDADQQAKHIASQAAAATVQLHTALNLALNMTALTPLFRESDQAIVQWWKKNGAAQAGETPDAWLARISEAVPEGMPLNRLLNMRAAGPARLGLEAFQEGLEEVNTQYAEHVGKAIGEGKEKKDVTGRFADLDRYFSEVLNQEGALNMALGALGGVAQTMLLDHIPVHKVVKYGPDGKPLITDGVAQTERISSHTMDSRMNRQYFDNIKDSLSKDMQWFSEKNKELEAAMKSKDLATIARVKADLLSVHNLRAISLGLGDVWKQQYDDIAAIDNTQSIGEKLQPQLEAITKQMEEAFNSGNEKSANELNVQRMKLLQQKTDLMDTTEAMQKGFAQNKADNSYRDKAMQAKQTLDYLTELHANTQDKYTGTPEMDQAGLADHMFYRQANLYLQKQQLDNMNNDLMKLKARVDEMNMQASPEDDLLVNQAKDYISDKEVWETTVKKLNQDIARLNEAVKSGNSAVFLKILDKYKIPASKDAAKQLVDLLERRKGELESRAASASKELNDTLSVWQEVNPGKSANEVIQKAAERPVLEDVYKQNKAYYQQAITEHQIAKEQFATDSTEKGIRKFLTENKPVDNKKKQNKEHIEAYNQQLDREIASNMDVQQKKAMVEKIDSEITILNGGIRSLLKKLEPLKRLLANSTGFKNYFKRVSIRSEINDIREIILEEEMKLNTLKLRRTAMVEKAQQATQQQQNTSRTPPPVVHPVTTPSPGSTPAANTTQEADEEFSDELPNFDFSAELTPAFTTIEEGNATMDRIMGSNEAGNIIRQYIQLRSSSDITTVLTGIRTMLQRTNQQMLSQEEFDNFIEPYVRALQAKYSVKESTATKEYEDLKSILKPQVLATLDALETEFKATGGFSYDRTKQALQKHVVDNTLGKQVLGTIMNRLKAYLEEKIEPVVESTSVEEVAEQQENDQQNPVVQEITENSTAHTDEIIKEQIADIEKRRRLALEEIQYNSVADLEGIAALRGVKFKLKNSEIGTPIQDEKIKALIEPWKAQINAQYDKELADLQQQQTINVSIRNSESVNAPFELVVNTIQNGRDKLVPLQDYHLDYIEQNLERTKVVDRGKMFHAMDAATTGHDFQVLLKMTKGEQGENADNYYKERDRWFAKLEEYMTGKQNGTITGSLKDFLFPVTPIKETSKTNYLQSKQNIDGTITVYRGVMEGGEKGTGQFWTTNKDVAQGYANRQGGSGEIISRTIPMNVAMEHFMGIESNQGPAQGSDIFSLPDSYNSFLTESNGLVEGSTTYVPPTPDSEPTVFSNSSLDLQEVQQQNKVFVGAGNIEAVKANFNTHPYKEFDNGLEVRIVADYTELDPKLNTDLLIPGKIIPNDDVTFVVDEEWSGEINYDTEMVQDDFGEQLRRADMFQNYLDSPGKIGMSSNAQHPKGAHANVPIKIIHNATGKVIGYLPRADWVLAKYPDTGNYRNVVDEYSEGETQVTDNVARQYGRIIKLREAVVRAWNTDKNLKLTSKVTKRGTGHVMLNRDTNPNTGKTKLVNRSAKNMLPDPSLEIAVFKQGTAYVGSGIASQKQVAAHLPTYLQEASSLPVAMLPSPDGTYVPTPLYTHKLGDNPSQLNTVVSAITVYLKIATGTHTSKDTTIASKINQATGFDISLPEGLRGFIQQYFTYTQKFNEKDTVITPSEARGKANPEFMFDIPGILPGEKAAFIKVGTSFSGEKPMYAQLVNGELHQDFEQALRDGLSNRFKNVVFAGKELRGINSGGEFKAPIIKKDGTVQVNTFANYNEYVKANSTTFAYGLNQVDGKYVYMANPVVQLDYSQALKAAPPVISTGLSEQTTEQQIEDQELEEPDELADLFGNGILSPSPGSVVPVSIPEQGEQVSLELLQELRNLTPEAHRNTKTPEQVLRELLERGVTVLAENHNPFYVC